MKKIYRIEGLDCAVCAVKIEDKIKNISGVEDVYVNFLTGKFMLQAEDELFDGVFEEALKIIKKIDSSVVVSE